MERLGLKPRGNPPAARPAQWRINLAIGCIATVVVCAAIVVGGVKLLFASLDSSMRGATEHPKAAARAFVDSIRAGKRDDAYASAADDFKEVRSLEEWRKAPLDRIVASESTSFSRVSMMGGHTCVEGTLKPDVVHIVLSLEGGDEDWKVRAFSHTGLPECLELLEDD
jgi:hypothetical protein